MAKVTYLKLKLENNIEPEILNWKGLEIEVKQYLPVAQKLELISNVINLSADDNNFANWKKGASYKDITLKGNCVETINSSDGYSITSTQIAQLAESVAGWLTTNEFANVNEAMSGGTTEQIAELTAYFTNASNWSATV